MMILFVPEVKHLAQDALRRAWDLQVQAAWSSALYHRRAVILRRRAFNP